MKHCFLSILLCAAIVACTEEVIKKPENLIPPEKMENILYDLALVNAAKNTNPNILEEHNIVTMQYIYEKYGVDSVQFVDSDIYYASKPVIYQTIYKRIEARLEQEKEVMEEERRRVSDSLRIEAEKQREAQARRKSSE